MKKILFSVLLCFPLLSANAQQTLNLLTGEYTDGIENTIPTRDIEEVDDGIIVTYSLAKISNRCDADFPETYRVSINEFGCNHEHGKPMVPVRNDAFVIPTDIKPFITIIDSSYVDIPMTLAPSRQMLKESEMFDKKKRAVAMIQPYDGYYPSQSISIGKIWHYRGTPLVDVEYWPVKYNYANKSIRVFTNIRYKINYQQIGNNSGVKMAKNTFISPDDHFLNYISDNYRQNPVTRSPSTTYVETTRSYLILTTPEYEEVANYFAEWKRTVGFNVVVKTDSLWTENKIEMEISNNYYTLDYLYYLLIIGGQNDVPAKYCYLGTSLYSDFPYGCISNSSLPQVIQDIYVGRLPVSSVTEAYNMVNKIINYERNPVTDASFYNTGLHVSFFSGGGREDFNEYVRYSELARNQALSYNKNVIRLYKKEDSIVNPAVWHNEDSIPAELRDPQFDWDTDSVKIANEINNGAFYVFHRDHGSINGWEYPEFKNSFINNLSNGEKLPIFFNIDCSTGSFYNGECFAKKLLTKENGGAVAVMSATEDTYSDANNDFTLSLFNTIFTDFNDVSHTYYHYNYNRPFSISQIINYSKANFRKSHPSTTQGVRFENHTYHCFGDPSMIMHIAPLTPIDTVSIIREDSVIRVYLDDAELETCPSEYSNPYISFYNRLTKEVHRYCSTEIDYECDEPNTSVYIQWYNKIPVLNECRDTLFIQNDYISGPKAYKAYKSIKVGSYVTSEKENGSVTFHGGKITLEAPDVELQGETTIDTGTEFEIKTK